MKAALLVSVQTTGPMELVCIDFLSLKPDDNNTKDILVVTDHFTHYVPKLYLPRTRHRAVAKVFWENYFVHNGFPERLHSD